MNIDEIGKDFEKDAVAFSIENQKLRQQERQSQQRIMELSYSLMDMMHVFDMLTREGGWDTLEEEHRKTLLGYRDKARKVYRGEEESQ